jgi:hypothetical protein
MEGLPEHDQIESAVPGCPAFELGYLGANPLLGRDRRHSRIGFHRKDIKPFEGKLFRQDASTRAHIEHTSSSQRHKIVNQWIGVTRPAHIIGSRRGTK